MKFVSFCANIAVKHKYQTLLLKKHFLWYISNVMFAEKAGFVESNVRETTIVVWTTSPHGIHCNII